MSERKIRVLVVDDSAVIREMICDHVSATTDMEVIGTAADGRKALATLEQVQPDVITLDVQMPNLDGLATLDAILARRPVPVVMVSSLTQAGAATTWDALDRGAIDYVAKPESGALAISVLRDELLRKIRAVYRIDVKRILEIRRQRRQRTGVRPAPVEVKPSTPATVVDNELVGKCIAIGISTGGPPALAGLFENLVPPLPPIVVVQHMPAQFTKPFAWRLNSLSKLAIREAADGDVLEPNGVWIAPGGRHIELRRLGNKVRIHVLDTPPVSGHKPSADVLMRSAAAAFGSSCLGVIMTGMGRDGADGCRAIREAGGFVLGQDEATSDVYGMNKVAWVEGHVDRQFPLKEAATQITQQIKRLGSKPSPRLATV